MKDLPNVELAQLQGSDAWGLNVGEEALHVKVEYRGPKYWGFKLLDLRGIHPRTGWITGETVEDLRASRKYTIFRDMLKEEFGDKARQILESIIAKIQDNEETWLPKEEEETEKTKQESSFDEETMAKARQLLKDPSFFYKLGKVFEWGYVVPKLNKPRFIIGEERNKRLLGPLLIGASQLNMTSIIKVLGEIGTAKDSMLRLWLKLLPTKSVERSYLTAASIRYSQSLQNADLIYIPDSPALKGEMGRHMRFMRADDGGLISEYAMRDSETGEMTTKTVRVPVKGVATTSNAITGDPALESGMWTLQTNDSEQLTHRVKEEKLRFRAGNRPLFPEDELKVWQCAFHILVTEEAPEQLPAVRFAEGLIAILESTRSESRRDPDKLCDLISLIGWSRRFQKPTNKRKSCDLVDFYYAFQLGLDAITETISELGRKEQVIFQVVKDSQESVTVRQVADETGIPYKTCYGYLEKLIDKGFLNKDKEKGRNVYSVFSEKVPKQLLISKGSSSEKPEELMKFILRSFQNFSTSHQGTEYIIFPETLQLIDPITGEQLTIRQNNESFDIEVFPCPDEIKYYPYPHEKVRSSELTEQSILKTKTETKNLLPSQIRSSEQAIEEKDHIPSTLTIQETLVLLRSAWQKGVYNDFDKLIMEVKGCTREEAEALRDKWLDEGVIGYDEGWLVWVK